MKAQRLFPDYDWKHSRFVICLSLVASMLLVSNANAQSFTNRNDLLTESDHQSGVAMGVVDMNGDGKDDIVRLNQGTSLSIEYQQVANGAFSVFNFGDIDTSGREWSMAIGDVDNNGFNDLLAGGAYNGIKILTANSSGTDYTNSTLADSDIFLQGSNFVDINNDGWLDIFGCHDDDASRSYRNQGDGTLVFDNSLFPTEMDSGNSGNYGSVWTDYDNDGDLDMYLSKCRQGATSFSDPRRINRLFENDGTNSFTESANTAGLEFGDQSWATDFADIDNDGDMDCFILNHDSSSLLMLNNGDGTFTDITALSGMSVSDLDFYGIQVAFRDFDNDGFVDLLCSGTEHRLFHNNGDGTFTRQSNPFGSNEIESFAIGDLNSDGFLDIYAGYANLFNTPSNIDDVMFLNDGGSNGFFTVLLEGTTCNRNGVGARVELHGAWGIQCREVRSGESYGIMNSLRQHFGIGSANSITKLVVKWPSGNVDVLVDPAINQNIILVEGSTLPISVAGASFNVTTGTLVSGGLAELSESDNADLTIRRNSIDILARASFEVTATSPFESPSRFDFTLEASVFARSGVTQTISLYNYVTDSFEQVDSRAASLFSDSTVEVQGSGDLSRFVEPGTGTIEARIEYASSVGRLQFTSNVDQVSWTIE